MALLQQALPLESTTCTGHVEPCLGVSERKNLVASFTARKLEWRFVLFQ